MERAKKLTIVLIIVCAVVIPLGDDVDIIGPKSDPISIIKFP